MPDRARVGLSHVADTRHRPRPKARRDEYQDWLKELDKLGTKDAKPADAAVRKKLAAGVVPRESKSPAAGADKPHLFLTVEPDRISNQMVCRIVPQLERGPADVTLTGVEVKKITLTSGDGGKQESKEEDVAADRYRVELRKTDALIQFKDDGRYRITPVASGPVVIDKATDGCVVDVSSKGPLFFLEIAERASGRARKPAERRFPFLEHDEEVELRGRVKHPGAVRDAKIAWDPNRPEPLRSHDLLTAHGCKRVADGIEFDLDPETIPIGFHIVEGRACDSAERPRQPIHVIDGAGQAQDAPKQGEEKPTGKRKGLICDFDEMTSKVFRSALVGDFRKPGEVVKKAFVFDVGADLMRLPNDLLSAIVAKVKWDGLLKAFLLAIDPEKLKDPMKIEVAGGTVGISLSREDNVQEKAWAAYAATIKNFVKARKGDGLQALLLMLNPRDRALSDSDPLETRRRDLYLRLAGEAAKLSDAEAKDAAKASALLDKVLESVAQDCKKAAPDLLTVSPKSPSTAPFAGRQGLLFTVQTSELWVDLEYDFTKAGEQLIQALREKLVPAIKSAIDNAPPRGDINALKRQASEQMGLAAANLAQAAQAQAELDRKLKALSEATEKAAVATLNAEVLATRGRLCECRKAAEGCQRAADEAWAQIKYAAVTDFDAFKKFIAAKLKTEAASAANAATWVYDAFLAPALKANLDGAVSLLESALKQKLHFNLMPFADRWDLLVSVQDFTAVEIDLRSAAAASFGSALQTVATLVFDGMVTGVSKLLISFFEWLTEEVRGAASKAVDALLRAKAGAEKAENSASDAIYDWYVWAKTDKKQYEAFKQGLQADAEQARQQIDRETDAQIQLINGMLSVLKSQTDAWFEGRVRGMMQWLVSALSFASDVAVASVADKLSEALTKAASGIGIRVGTTGDGGVSLRVKMPAGKALALDDSLTPRLLKWPLEDGAKDRLTRSDFAVLLHDGNITARFDANGLAALIGGNADSLRKALGDTAEALGGKLEVRFEGRPELTFTDTSMSVALDLALKAWQPALDAVCKSCDGKGTVEEEVRGKQEKSACHVCFGSGKQRRGRGWFSMPASLPPVSATAATRIALNGNFANQLAYALWEGGLFDLTIPKKAHPLKDAIRHAAQMALEALTKADPNKPKKEEPPPASYAAWKKQDPKVTEFGIGVVKDLVAGNQILDDFSFTSQATMPPLVWLSAGGKDASQTVHVAWGDLVIDLDMKWKSIPVKVRVQLAFEAAGSVTAQRVPAKEAGKPDDIELKTKLAGFDVQIDFLTPLFGIDPDYIVILLEYTFEQIALALIDKACKTFTPTSEYSLQWMVDKLAEAAKGIKPIADRLTALNSKGGEAARKSIALAFKDILLNPVDARGYLSGAFGIGVKSN